MMSRIQAGSKPLDFFSCIPKPKCLQKDSDQVPSDFASALPAAAVDELGVQSVNAKLEHTRQWLLDQSTVEWQYESGTYTPSGSSCRKSLRNLSTVLDEDRAMSSSQTSSSWSELDLSWRHRSTCGSSGCSSCCSSCSLSTVGHEIRHQVHHPQHCRQRSCSAQPSRTSSIASRSSSVISLTTEVVLLDLERDGNLGISVVGHTNTSNNLKGDFGIYVGKVREGGAAYRSGRISDGDLIMSVNGISLERLDNDDAMETLRTEVSKRGVMRMRVGKFHDSLVGGNDDEYQLMYRSDASIDPDISMKKQSNDNSKMTDLLCQKQTLSSVVYEKSRGLESIPEVTRQRMYHEGSGMSATGLALRMHQHSPVPPSNAMMISTGVTFSVPHLNRQQHLAKLHAMHSFRQSPVYENVPLAHLVRSHSTLIVPSSGPQQLCRRLRNLESEFDGKGAPFTGQDFIQWIQCNVRGLESRMDALTYASKLLTAGYIVDAKTSEKIPFSEHGVYIFGIASNDVSMSTPMVNLVPV